MYEGMMNHPMIRAFTLGWQEEPEPLEVATSSNLHRHYEAGQPCGRCARAEQAEQRAALLRVLTN